jgi:diguanylate cyclase
LSHGEALVIKFNKLYPDDPKQAVRIRRFYMAASTSILVLFLVSLCNWLGFVSSKVLGVAGALILLILVVFYILFQTKLNLKFRDPSLTAPQMLASSLTMIYVMHNAAAARGIFLIVILMIFMFVVFRLSGREFLQIALVVLAAYAVLIWPVVLRPTKTADDNLAILYGVVLAVVLPWFAMMGAYIGRLRRQLNTSIAELESSQAIAVRDDLTGAYNRRYLMGSLYKEKNRSDRGGEPFSMCLIDIDFFKRVNDTKGHLIGDQVLTLFTQAIQPDVRTTDYFGRFGGEEFLLILSETSASGACAHAERVRRSIEQHRFPEIDGDLRITVSIGVTQYRPREEISNALNRADRALYDAKASGRNRVVCDGVARSPVGNNGGVGSLLA